MTEKDGYAGKIAFASWVLSGRLFVDNGIKVHKSPRGAAGEIQGRLDSLRSDGPPEITGSWVEEVKPDGSSLSAVRSDIEEL